MKDGEFRMVADGNKQVTISVKRHSLSVSVDTEFVCSFDKAGRLYTAYLDGRTYIRGLDNKLVAKWRREQDPLAPKVIEVLDEETKRVLLDWIRTQLKAIRREYQHRSVHVIQSRETALSASEDVGRWLERIVGWDHAAYERDREKFLTVYQPVSVLPPDQYLALVLQITEGCHWNKCTFCDFYRDRSFRVKSDPEVRRHISEVKDFFGDSISLRKSVFLADANALVVPQNKLRGILDAINEGFRFRSTSATAREDLFDGIYSFIDAYSAIKKTTEDFIELRERNLKRVYLGVESGCNELLRFANKIGKGNEALDVVRRIKAAGVNVGVIILIGLGGDLFFERHVRDTIDLLNDMKLSQGDIIYLSPLFIHPGSDYERKAAECNIRPLDYPELKRQMQLIKGGLRFPAGERPPKISTYDVREFIY